MHVRSNGEGGIRTPGRAMKPYDGLANRSLQPLGHLSCPAGVPPARNIIESMPQERLRQLSLAEPRSRPTGPAAARSDDLDRTT